MRKPYLTDPLPQASLAVIIGIVARRSGRRKSAMIKVTYVVFKKPDMSREEFSRYWRDTHAPLAKKVPGLRKYVQNHALPDPEGGEPPYDGTADIYFDSPEAMQESLATPEGQAVLADIPNFCDPDKTVAFPVEEVKVI